jgi:hypothetical protein
LNKRPARKVLTYLTHQSYRRRDGASPRTPGDLAATLPSGRVRIYGAAMKHVIQMSGGLSSAEAAARVASQFPRDRIWLVFCDTIVEDADLYRFLIEASAYVLGEGPVSDLVRSLSLLPAVNEKTIDRRKEMLADLRRRTMLRIPRLVWLADGRTPWEVIFQSRFLSNRSDKCSEYLKRRLADAWCETNCRTDPTTRYLGYGYTEEDRIERSSVRFAKAGWDVRYPMNDAPLLNQSDLMRAWIDRGIQPPRLYYQGHRHNNCGGFCFKWGQSSAARLLANDPCYYGYNERQEDRFRESICADASTLKDRKGGGPRRPISLRQFREGIESGGMFDGEDRGACSCFAEVTDGEEETNRVPEVRQSHEEAGEAVA